VPPVLSSVYDGGSLKGEAGLESVLGGSAFFRNDETDSTYLGVWDARDASRFRTGLRLAGMALDIVHSALHARLAWWNAETRGKRPRRRRGSAHAPSLEIVDLPTL
jgi:hypothetical protein